MMTEITVIDSEPLQGERLKRVGGQASAADGDDDEDDTSSIESELDEELGFVSPLDSIDPYVSFKQSLTSKRQILSSVGSSTDYLIDFQMKNPALYSAATTALNIEQSTVLMEIMAIAEKNANATTQA